MRKRPRVVPTLARVSFAVPTCQRKKCDGPMVRILHGWSCASCTKIPVGDDRRLHTRMLDFRSIYPNRASRREYMGAVA